MEVLPPGFRFHPTDEELVAFYLHRKASGLKVPSNIIAEIDLYKHDPWELPNFSCISSGDSQWFFFNFSDKKYPKGPRTNRTSTSGYWKATGRDRKIVAKAAMVVGIKKTLVFYEGRAPRGERTGWVMHEYQLVKGPDSFSRANSASPKQPNMVVCRIMKKNKKLGRSKAASPTSHDDDENEQDDDSPPTITQQHE